MKKNFLIYGLLIIYFIVNTFVLTPLKLDYYNELINPIIWMSICFIAVFLSNDGNLRVKGEEDKTQSLIIVLILYIIIYFLSGLVFGFEKTPYSKDIFSIFKNLWSFAGVIFFQEFVRQSLVKNEKKTKINYVFMSILFALVNINYSNFETHFTDLQTSFTYSASVLVPTLIESIIMTYLVYIGGAKFSIIYRLFVTVPPFFVPIIPDLDWFGTAIIGVLLPLVVYIYLNYVHLNKTERFTKRERKKNNPIIYIPTLVFIGILICFVVGLFKYYPIAVLSGSMSPTFNRGDAAVIQKLKDSDKDKLKKGDIIQFVSGSKYVLHRIIEITNDEKGNKVFKTKGDHNNAADSEKITLENVKGKMVFSVPYIGYPSVWLSDNIS